ncbi:hypothetical protein RCIP0032_00266 [Klebsiella phage RCIP0032]|jgi:hypothetical protein|uniref:Chaperone for tail fiber formation n=7 Tax=Caudoviricetes TaxID=2731619 RepID=A0A0K1Y4V2_9CAUD|nr:hypothetical protein [Klebsiella variicola]YP_009190719.1 tail fiber chaperone [Klebsiella phage JD18]AUV57495.1 hypothetical protein KP1_136 [Klebsiella phage KP1]QEG11565.1 hypothetical protein KMI13_234 [Klebsiella phage KMI13]QEG11784.1 hypothetical protein KPN6_245 [Klebsiella phage KPN6]QGF21565.1 hypothetical protein JIPhKp122_0150 [Klebsiella phage JIPh_Kp122]QLF83020.1 hypothetical protein KpnM6E1_gp137 [Klebsiella phage KpnM6E1]QPX73748.1 hypothetical protein EVAN_107 [Klebsiell
MTTEQLQAQVDTLKVRVFDLSETIQGLSALRAQYEEVLQKLIAVSGVEISEDGQVKLDDLVAKIEAQFAEETTEEADA